MQYGRLVRSGSIALAAVLLALCLAGPGCKDSTKPANQGTPTVTPEPDFHLLDVNPDSPRAGQPVSPRDYIGKVSAWYFGHST